MNQQVCWSHQEKDQLKITTKAEARIVVQDWNNFLIISQSQYIFKSYVIILIFSKRNLKEWQSLTQKLR